jgi:hypothetical protein
MEVLVTSKLLALTSTACCALCCAFEHYPELKKYFAKFIPPELMDVFKEILGIPGRMILIPNTDASGIYGELASKELEGLRDISSETQLSCGHIVGEHREALELVTGVMKLSNN